MFYLILLMSFFSHSILARDFDKIANTVIGVNPTEKLSPHNPTYFILSDDDLKMQFSFKYRLTNVLPLFFGYTQTMFWKIYDKSKPFKDVNYQPEAYYRLWSNDNEAFKILDIGYIHNSNGKDKLDSRSFDKTYLRTSFLNTIGRHHFATTLTTHYINNEDDTNADIVNYYGYWHLAFLLTDIIHIDENIIDLEVQTFAGKKIINFNKGGLLIGVLYSFSPKVNTTLYFQRYQGYGEDLLTYNKKQTKHRLGFTLSY